MYDRLYPTTSAAMALGLTPDTLRSWRRRNIGPNYIKQSGGYIRSRGGRLVAFAGGSMLVGSGELHWCANKPNGSIFYREQDLIAFVQACMIPRGRRLRPRPFPGRLPRGIDSTVSAEVHHGTTRLPGLDCLKLYNTETAASMLMVAPET